MTSAVASWAIYTFGFSHRARALQFYYRLTPGITRAEVEKMGVSIEDWKPERDSQLSIVFFGAPGPARCHVAMVFERPSGVLLKKGVVLGDDQRPKWLVNAMVAIGIPYWNRTRAWPAP